MSNGLDSDQAQPFVGPDLGPNCLHGLLADNNICGLQVKTLYRFMYLQIFL